ncbi:hypothetical protein [Sulfuriferula nivalis]|uniref:Uncharacterized protein n=1 Tax=Sulfuriferula nivalis TaxID=2675298 RepID=A0A809RK72_9PROT|nr:hypothetical protein [Sulfuriferula nivalis]BBP01976.1 hypothetical protein SFSGTM_26840 [Sulfuriferula nivalis]
MSLNLRFAPKHLRLTQSITSVNIAIGVNTNLKGWCAMVEKVKVSLFLEPEVAKALKIQAARQETEGVSDLVSRFFVCAHCQEPITDDFVLGIKLVTPNEYGVFFHANREACRAASGNNSK